MQPREVVITGLGVVSPIGIGLEPFCFSLAEGRSGVNRLTLADELPLPVTIGAELRGFDAKAYVKPRKSMKLMCREIQTGFAAAEMAIEHAGVSSTNVDPERFGVVYGSDMLYCDIPELSNAYRICLREDGFVFDEWGARAINELYPLWMLKYLPNMTACHVGIRHDARGPNNTITLTEVSSLLAIMESAMVIERGDADVMVAGGTGSKLPLASMLYRGSINVSPRTDPPQEVSRPFDAERDGMVLGEGAAAMILESEQHATARGARIIGRISGWGSSFHPPGGDRSGIQTAITNSIRAALRSGQAGADEVGYVNAHGLSGVLDDQWEARAIAECLGDVPVTACKSYFGNLGAAGGMVEAAASLVTLGQRVIPKTLNTSTVATDCPVNVVREGNHPRPEQPSVMLLNQSTTGQAVSLLLTAE